MWILFTSLLLLVDILTKRWTLNYLSKVNTIPVIKDVFHLTYVENRGVAFGMFANRQWMVLCFTILAVLGLVIYLVRLPKKQKLLRYTLAMIIAGAIGNIIDRAVYGFVVDMIDVRLINFWVFNFADVCICVGFALWMIYILFLEGKQNG